MSQNQDKAESHDACTAVDSTDYDALACQFADLRRQRHERASAEFERLGRSCRTLPYSIVAFIMEFYEYTCQSTDCMCDPFSELVGRFARDPSRTPVCIFPSIAIVFDPRERSYLLDGHRGVSFPKFVFALRGIKHLWVVNSFGEASWFL